MKQNNLIVVFMLLILFSSCADMLSGNSEEEKQLFQQIKVGMTQEEVVQILGKPDSIVPSSSDKDIYQYYFTKSKSSMRSEMPYVLFDSMNKVKFSTYGDGG